MKSFFRLFLILLFLSSFNNLFGRVNTIHISTQDPSCFGSTDGYVTIDSLTTTAPSGNYTITINTAPVTTFNVGDTVFNLTTKTYTITVEDGDDGNRRKRISFFIQEPAELIVDLFEEDVSCFGSCDGSIEAVPDFGNDPYAFEWSTGRVKLSGDEDTLKNLCVGVYSVTVTDNNGCSAIDSVEIFGPAQVQPGVIVTDIECDGETNGTATAIPTSDVGGPYTFAWSSSANTDSIETNLGQGNYTITVTDKDGCSSTENFTIDEPDPISFSLSKIDNTCFGELLGTITVSDPTGGTPTYSFEWDDGPITQNRTNLSAGNYRVVVTDNNGCTEDGSITIDEPNKMEMDSTIENVFCNGDATGTAKISVSGGSAPYDYNWEGAPTGNGTDSVSELTVGTYKVTITDDELCEVIDSVTITGPTEILITFDNLKDPTCNNGIDGEVNISVSGGTPGVAPNEYTYLWTDGYTTQDISGLSAKNYAVIVTDANGCEATFDTTLVDPAAINPNIVTDSVSCRGGDDGRANATGITGGTPPYSYDWGPGSPTGDNTNSISGLTAGNYTLEVIDDNNCTINQNFTVGEPAAGISFDLNATDNLCFDDELGRIEVSNEAGGTPPYDYEWNDGPIVKNRRNLKAGTYILTITDQSGCEVSKTIDVDEPNQITMDSTIENILCNGDASGTAKISIAGGTAPYNYDWEGNPTGNGSDSISNLTAGIYRVTITDDELCEMIDSVTITEPSQIIISFDNLKNPSCTGDDNGEINVSVSGGTQGVAPNEYTYLWTDGFTTKDISGLTAKNYILTVTDANGCEATFDTTLVDPAPLTAVIDSTRDASCNGDNDGFASVLASGGTAPYSYEWPDATTDSSISDLIKNSYEVTVTDANGCTKTAVAVIDEPISLTASIDETDPSCFNINDGRIVVTGSGGTAPYTYSWNPVNSDGNIDTNKNLTGGIYFVTVTDVNGCEDSKNITLTQPTAISSTSEKVDAGCNGDNDGKAWVEASGGNAPYTYLWDAAANDQITDTAFNLTAGTYEVTITDANECELIDMVTVGEPTEIVSTITTEDENCDGSILGNAKVSSTGGSPNYSYKWAPVAQIVFGQNTDSVAGLVPGNYSLTVTDNIGCEEISSFTINTESASFTFKDSIVIDSCNGGCLGFAGIFNLSGGLAPYTFQWNDPDNSTTSSIDSLCAGTYRVTITDDNTCDFTHEFTITQPTALDASVVTTKESCFPGDDGEASVAVAGGTLDLGSDYSYEWEEGGSITNSKDDYSAGDYEVTVTDDYGCSIIEPFTIGADAFFTVTETITNVSCFGEDDGEIDLSIRPAFATYTFVWDDGPTTEDRLNLEAGDYDVTITRTGPFGCTETQSYTVTEPTLLEASVVTQPESCSPGSDGEAVVTAMGGTAGYTYAWTGGGSITDTNRTYSAGNYSVTVTDDNGCDTIIDFTIESTAPFSINLDSVPVTCNGGNNGKILLTTNANSPTFAWSDGLAGTNPTGLSSQTYYVTVTDNNGCVKSDSILVSEPDPIEVDVDTTEASCSPGGDGTATLIVSGGTLANGNNYSFTWTPNVSTTNTATNLSSGTYNVRIEDDSGCFVLQDVIITEAGNPTIVVDSFANVLCKDSLTGYIAVSASGGLSTYSYLWDNGSTGSVRENLADGNYAVTLTDSRGCTDSRTFTIAEPATGITINFNRQDEQCFGQGGGSITLTVSGGTPFSDPNNEYTYLWDDGETTKDRTGIISGTYIVVVTDSNGCAKSQTFVVTSQTEILINFDTTNIICPGLSAGGITATAVAGVAPYSYEWSSGETNRIISGKTAGVYKITVTDDNGCIKVDSAEILEPDAIDPQEILQDESCTPGGDGKIDVSNTIGGTSPYQFNWGNGSSDDTLGNLIPGDYLLTITDVLNCDAQFTFTINSGAEITLNENIEQASCFGICDGSIKLDPTGGVAPYSYSWDSGSTADSIGALCAGTYDVTITDNTNCEKIAQFTIGSNAEIVSNISTSDEVCANLSDGTASVKNAQGGTPPFTYEWSTGSVQDSISDLAAGDYFVIIFDAANCFDTTFFTISSGSTINLTVAIDSVGCFGDSTGQIAVFPTNGQIPYEFEWSAPITSTNQLAPLLPIGNYSVTVTDGKGCTKTEDFEIGQPNQLTASVSSNNASCSPGGDGNAVVTALEGTPGYRYVWSAGTTFNDSVAGLAEGTYTVTVRDNNGCEVEVPFSIGSGAEITLNEDVTDDRCVNQGEGQISLAPTGGSAPYQFIWDNVGPTSADGDTAFNLLAGDYRVTVVDDLGCQRVDTIVVGEPASSIKANVVATDESCSPGGDGSASVSGIGGTGSLSFKWSTNETANSISNLSPGGYSVVITDQNDCDTVIFFTIGSGGSILPNASLSNLDCFGICDGIIALNPSGGTAPYTFDWDINVSDTSITGDSAKSLCKGDYTVTITDNLNCVKIETYTITEADSIKENLVITDETCSPGGDGIADASGATGGTGALTYKWSFPNGGNSGANSLSPGDYSLTITDANSCEKVVPFTIGSGSEIDLNATIDTNSCNGDSNGIIALSPSGGQSPYTYQWPIGVKTSISGDSALELKAGTYSVTVTDNAPCTKISSFTVKEAPIISPSFTITNASCNPGMDGKVSAVVSGGTSSNDLYNFTWPNVSNTTDNFDDTLSAGNYFVTIEDDNNCEVVEPFTIGKDGTAFTLSITNKDNIDCNGNDNGSITIGVTGGTAPFQYDWTNSLPDTSTVDDLSDGTYEVTVTDASGCTNTIDETITEPRALTATFVTQNSNCNPCSGSITATPSGGTGAISVAWLDNLKAPISQTGNSATLLCAGTYYAALRDRLGCTDTLPPVIVLDNNAPDATIDSVDEKCLAACDGLAFVKVQTITPNITISWEDALGNNIGSTDTIRNLCVGTYFATVTNTTTGCKTILSTIVNPGNQITPNLTAKDEDCNTLGVCSGNAKVSPTGGLAPYTFNWNGPTGPPSGNLTDSVFNLCAGNYSVTITDDNLCDTIVSFTIEGKSTIDPNEVTVDESCGGASDGSISLFPAGGAAPYTYTWSSNTAGGNVSSQTALGAGTYTVTIAEAGLCDTVLTINLGTSAFDYSISKTDLSCNGIDDGTADVAVVGGSTGFSFSWSPAPGSGQNTKSVTGLAAQEYFVTITDAAACSAIDSVTIDPNTPILANEVITDASCNGSCDGEINLNPSGGAGGPYSYSWPDGSANNPKGNLCSGSYSVTITDAASCTEVFNFSVGNSGVSINADVTLENVICGNNCDGRAFATPTGGTAPYTYVWSPSPIDGQFTDTAKNLCKGNYTVVITDNNGCSVSESFTIGGPDAISATFAVVEPGCNFTDGSITATPNGGDGNYTFEWFDNNFNSIGNSNPLSSIGSGIYYLDITDGAACSVRLDTTLNDIGSESLTVTSENESCYNSTDGIAEVIFNCSDPSCTVKWIETATGDSVGNTKKITNLPAGKYTAEVINNSGCKSFETVIIEGPAAYEILGTSTPLSCSDINDGAIAVSVGGSNGNYSYNWSPSPLIGQNTNSISNLGAGTYLLTVSDANSCDTVVSFDVGSPDTIVTTFSRISANCAQSDGSITATISGGTIAGSYNLQWFDGANTLLVGETNESILNISSGNYDLRVIDDNTCEERFTAILDDINGPTVIIDSAKGIDCFDEKTGAVYITANGTNAPFTFNWLNKGQTSEDITNLPAGKYSVQVTDANGCIGTVDTTIAAPSELETSISAIDATCGQCNGEASVIITGGTSPYNYLWSNGSTADTAAALCAGVYTLEISDANGCSQKSTFTINTIRGPTGETVSATATSCATSCDGSVTVTPTGGTLPYTYLWQHNGATTNTLNDLCKGKYFLNITDAKGCSRNVEVNIDSPNELIVEEKVKGALCGGIVCDGNILLNVNGGQKPYTYNWSPTQTDTNFINGLCAGIYKVTVSDANNCSVFKTYSISNNTSEEEITPSEEDVSCFESCDGSLTSNISPSSSISFVWLDNNSNQISPVDTDLNNVVCAGVYFLQVTSLPEGCLSYYEVEVDEPDSITLSSSVINKVSCFGECDGEVFISTVGGNLLYTYSWDDPRNQDQILGTNLCAGTYGVTATDANGCSAITSVTLTQPTLLNALINSSTDLSCSSDCNATASSTAVGGTQPYTFNWDGGQVGESPDNLCFGRNILTVTDVLGCTATDTVFISANDTVVAIASATNLVCFGDSINLSGSVTGSTVVSSGWYSEDFVLFSASLDTSFLRNIGDYTFYLIASNGACSDTAEVNISVVPNPSVNVTSSYQIFKEEVATLRVGNQDISYTYVWTPPSALNNSSLAEPTSSTRETRTYTLTVTDTNNCNYVDSVEVLYSPEIKIPSGLSPNDDGTNDRWEIPFLEDFPRATVQIYNRWGELIYEQLNGYTIPWDGTYEGKALPIGTYYYVIDLNTNRFDPITGPITIVR